MTATTLEKPQQEAAPLYINRAALEFPEKPFAHDVLNRKKLADQLTSYINRLSKGHTIGVDGDWGSGKTYFGKNWYMQLKTEGYPVVWLDAFAVDYCEDPFLPIANELRKLTAGSSHNAGVVENTKSIGKVLIPAVGSATVSGLLKLFIGEGATEKLGEDLANALGDLTEKQLEEKMRSFDQQCSSVAHLKRALTDFSASKSKPLVFFIDELDRCRPDFAVKLLERIKHFFETENVVFVLLINHQQLAASVQGLYGGHIDGSAYLRKFIHFEIQLPNITSYAKLENPKDSEILFLETTEQIQHQLGIDVSSEFLEGLAFAHICFNMSLRDIQQSMIYYQLLSSNKSHNKKETLDPLFDNLYGWLIGMKITSLEVFKECKTDKEQIHEGCTRKLQKSKENNLQKTLIALHLTQLAQGPENMKICEELLKKTTYAKDLAGNKLLPLLISQLSLDTHLSG